MTGVQQLGLTLSGAAFDGRTSRRQPATLQVAGSRVTLILNATVESHWHLHQLRIDPSVPGIRRVVRFPDGARFETGDDAAVTMLERHLGQNRALGGIRQLEGRWWTAVGALVLTLALTAAFVVYGIPAVARGAAAATPSRVLAVFDRETIDLLDGEYLAPSTLSRARQAQLQSVFRRATTWAGGPYTYRLLLRDGEPEKEGLFQIGANAFALPNGTVVMTDQLVALSGSDRELLGVMVHEAGHVTGRHVLAGVYQGLGLTLLTVAVTGDVVSASTFAAAVPATLLSKGYSRAAERESDALAGRFLMGAYGTTRPLRDLLARMEASKAQADEKSADETSRLENLLATHPGTSDRIRHLKEIEERGRPQKP